MPCTTMLVGKAASYDGSTIIARNDDAGGTSYTAKKLVVVQPKDQPHIYETVGTHLRIELPDDPMPYTAVPDAESGKGVWAASGINAANVGMTATESISSNERVLGADPLVSYIPKEEKKSNDLLPLKLPLDEEMNDASKTGNEITQDKTKEDGIEHDGIPGGIGEEDFVVLVLPYINTARDGVCRLGELLTQYGTNEMNGIGFQDEDEIWWMETIGGHHWIAKRLPDDCCAGIPNEFWMDEFDLNDAMGEQKENLCSEDLPEFIEHNHLDLELSSTKREGIINPRLLFGSHDDSDHVYNTPRAWDIGRYLAPKSIRWDGENAQYTTQSDDIPWCFVPDRKITVEDVKYVLSLHFQGTAYDPYGSYDDPSCRGMYRSVGINRTDFLAILQIRKDKPEDFKAVEWICFASNVFNAVCPFYTNVERMPSYLSGTKENVSTDNLYWSSRILGALADASYAKSLFHIERYQLKVQSKGHKLIAKYDALQEKEKDNALRARLRKEANEELAAMLQKETEETLKKVLQEATNRMKNQYSRSDH